jgi:release factor glutamine methyltransferase
MTREEKWILDEKYRGQETEGFFADCARLNDGVPLAYIIGSIPFLNTTISLDSHPLIPRPETEYWVEKAITHIKSKNRGDTPISAETGVKVRDDIPYLKVLDLCAGSGCIGIAVAKAIPSAHVTFAELDPAHLPTIKKNLESNHTIDDTDISQHTLAQSDLFENVTGKFDFILTNPPYIYSEAKTVAESVTSHEPHIALFGGTQGLEIIERIINDAKKYLTSQGILYIEHEPTQIELLKSQGESAGFSVTTHTDQYGVLRFSVFTMA